MKLRPLFFWFHLTIGLTVGLVVFFLAFTGFLLSFEPQIISFSERSLKTVSGSGPQAEHLGLDQIIAKVKMTVPDQEVSGITLYRNSNASCLVSLGREGTLYVNPYTAEVLGQGSCFRSFFNTITDLHRWFGFQGKNRDIARTVKGICTVLFGLSLLSGFYLWWPKQWTFSVFKVIAIPAFRFRGKQRDFNWHNAVGFWSAPWLFIIVLTGIIMIYPWANDLLYRAAGDEPPPRPAASSGPMERKIPPHSKNKVKPFAGFDAYLAAAEKQAPDWQSVNIRMPQGNRPNVMAVIEEPSSPNAYSRSLLTLDTKTAEIVKWEPYEGYNLGRKLRICLRAIHTGEAGGILGQLIAALAVLGAMVLVWTGFNMASYRFFKKKGKILK
jgi:uncharacterized iron-regulated membrane protein